MEHLKISKLLSDSTVSKLVTRKWIVVNDLPSGLYSVNNNIRFKTLMLRSDLCEYSDVCIFAKGTTDFNQLLHRKIKHRKILCLNTMQHLGDTYQKLTAH